jgi:hypothetical protein
MLTAALHWPGAAFASSYIECCLMAPSCRLFPCDEVGVIAAHANDRKMAAKSVQVRVCGSMDASIV